MSYNKTGASAQVRGLVNSGADLLKHMYDVSIHFPGANGMPENEPFSQYPITVRTKSFSIPEVEVGTYEIRYHGVGVKRPNANLVGDRQVEIPFREDAAFNLRRKFSAWMMAVGDPVTGGVSNAAQFFGRIEVGTIAGAYFATTMHTPHGQDGGKSKGGANDIMDNSGHLTTRNDANPLALWKFYNVWVSKIGPLEFSTDTTEPNEFTVTFQYMDIDYPQFGGNALDLGEKGGSGAFSGTERWTGNLVPAAR